MSAAPILVIVAKRSTTATVVLAALGVVGIAMRLALAVRGTTSACVGLVLPLRHQLLRPRTLVSDLVAKRVNSRRISSGYNPR